MYWGIPEAGNPSYVMLYDLAAGKQVGRIKGRQPQADVFSASFIVDDTVYGSNGRKIGKVEKVPSADWKMYTRIPGTDLVAFEMVTDKDGLLLTVQDLSTGKRKHQIKTGIKVGGLDVSFVSDRKQLFAIANFPIEGEVLSIDLATGKLQHRGSPPACPAGTVRR